MVGKLEIVKLLLLKMDGYDNRNLAAHGALTR